MFGEVEMMRCGEVSAAPSRAAVNPAMRVRCVILMELKLKLHAAHARSSGRWKAILEIILVENIVRPDKKTNGPMFAEWKPVASADARLVNPAEAIDHRRHTAEDRLQ